MVQSETKFIPALTVAERYDSNVYFVAGKNLQDYVTTVTPQLRIDHSGHLVKGNLQATLTGEYYAKNPGLNYIAPSGALTMNLDNLIGQLDRRVKLTVSDSFMFTPKPLAFIGPSTGSEVPDAFVRGIQTQRANSRTNMATATGAYLLTSTVSLQGNYTYSTMRFGTAFNTPNATATSTSASFFNTSYQNYSIGPQFQVTPVDSVSVTYQGSRAHFSQTGSGFSSKFETQGGTVGWKRTFTPTLTGDAAAGLTQIETRTNATLTYLVNASLEWKHEHGGAMLRYSRSVFPSFFVVAVPLLSNVITVSGNYLITGQLSATGSASYAKNESTSGQTQLSFDSYSITAALNYSITRTITAIASLTHSEFSQSFHGSDLTFNRNIASLSLRGEWN